MRPLTFAPLTRRMRLVLGILALVLGGVFPRARAESLPIYSVVDLGPMDGLAWSKGLAINATGQVAGTAQTPGSSQAFLGSPGGSVQILGSLAGESGKSQGLGIGDGGVVVGVSDFGHGSRRAFRSNGGGMVNLGTLSGGSWSEAVAINAGGEIAGHGNREDGRTVAFRITSEGTFVELGSLEGGLSSRAYGINALGHVVGESVDWFGVRRAFVADDQGMHAVGTLPGGGGSVARAINDDGLITGHATDASGRDMAFLGRPGALVALGLLPGGRSSYGLGINNLGDVVGHVAGSLGSRAFLWDATEGMVDLNHLIDPNSGWLLQAASGINDAGMIVGTGLKDGITRAFLLKLKTAGPPDPSGGTTLRATPEPGSLVMVLLGASGAGAWTWLRRRRSISRRIRSG
ncbi:PEP-CTERM sorting domain-containing protein [Tautonia rosea]|uniref:PEP-CTERM sorting domain-containing protein n=1 Tax=Tautonia rosea TaxID=2728037 RepID=UPI0014729096|nr:PEP-CTERM sorting domain-containing protein [Tautonia rosea]